MVNPFTFPAPFSIFIYLTLNKCMKWVEWNATMSLKQLMGNTSKKVVLYYIIVLVIISYVYLVTINENQIKIKMFYFGYMQKFNIKYKPVLG